MKYVCSVCGWEYDEEQGCPEKGIAPAQEMGKCPRRFRWSALRRGKGHVQSGRNNPFPFFSTKAILSDRFFLLSESLISQPPISVGF